MANRLVLPPLPVVSAWIHRHASKFRAVHLAIVAVLMCVGLIHAQTVPAAQSRVGRLDVGAGFSGFDTDAGNHPFEYGVAAFADLKFWRSLGIEFEGRTIQFDETQNIRQDTAMGGFRYVLPWRHLAIPYVKALAGVGSADFPEGTYTRGSFSRQHDTFSAIEAGGGVAYPLHGRFSLRGEYDYQMWLDYGRGPRPGYGMLNPAGFTIGIAYHIL